MDIEQLKAFDQIVRLGNFSKAARLLGIAQPTISLRMRGLENEVGGKLFQRGGNRLALTELGASFLPYARQAIAALTDGLETAQRVARGDGGRLIIGTLPSLSGGFFATTVARLYSEHPHIRVLIHTGHNQQITEMLRDGLVKVGFITWPAFHADLRAVLHVQEPLIVVTHPQHPLAQRSGLRVADLVQHGNPFLRVDWSVETRTWQIRVASDEPSEVEVPPHTAYDLVVRGTGVALLTRTFVNRDLVEGRLVELGVSDLPGLLRETILVQVAREAPLPAVVQEFIRIFREEARTQATVSIPTSRGVSSEAGVA